MRLARSTADRSGFRIAAEVPIAAATERLGQQAALASLWIEVDEDGGPVLDELLALAARESRDGRYSTVVSTAAPMLDPVIAALGDAPVEVLVDADAPARAAALAVAVSNASRPMRLSDVASDRSADQLRQLSEEVNRIATMLARLSAGPDQSPRPVVKTDDGDVPPVSVETIRRVIRARRLRARFFPEDLFADPAWDMLLDLLQAELSHLRVPVSSLCIAAAVPPTTALRWIKTLCDQGLFVRVADPEDGRRVFIELSTETATMMEAYLKSAQRIAPLLI